MTKKIIHASLPHLTFLTKALLIIAIFIMLGGSVLAMRMAQGPIDLEQIKPHIETALGDIEKGYSVKIEKLQLIWPRVTAPMLLDLDNVTIHQSNQTSNSQTAKPTPILAMKNINLGLSTLHLLRGKILPSRLIIEDPVFDLAKENAGATIPKKTTTKTQPQIMGPPLPMGEKIAEKQREIKNIRSIIVKYLQYLTNPKYRDLTSLSALKNVTINRAVIKDTSRKNDNDFPYLALMDLSLSKHNAGIEGNLVIDLPGSEGEKSHIKSYILYREEQQDLTFTADLKDINPAMFKSVLPSDSFLSNQDIQASGSLKIAFDKTLMPQIASFNLSIPKGTFTDNTLYETPLTINDIALSANYLAANDTLDIEEFKATVEGIGISGTAPVTLKKSSKDVKASLSLNIDTAPVDKIKLLFPQSQRESEAGRWITKKIENGRFHNVDFTTDLFANDNGISLSNTKAKFNIEGVTVKYSDTLMPVSDVIGAGTFENDTLTITGERGNIKDVKGRDITVKIADISVPGGGMAYIDLKANGPLSTVFAYISDKPISLNSDLGFKPAEVKGNIDFTLDLEFPTLKDLPKEKVIVKIDGIANNIYLPNIVRGLALQGGPYDLSFNDGLIGLKGSGTLDKKEITLDWKQYFNPEGKDFNMKLTAKIGADAALRKAFDIGLEEYITGNIPIDINYIEKGDKTSIDINGDLTPAMLKIDSFNYIKPTNVAGSLSVKAHLQNDEISELDQLSIKAPNLEISDGRILFRKFPDGISDISKGQINKFKIGETILSAGFEVTTNKTLKISATGPVFDLDPFINSDTKQKTEKTGKKKTSQPLNISLNTEKILADDGEQIGKSQIYAETNINGDLTRLEMDSKIGQGEMYLRFKPEEETGQRTFRLESSDAGYTLKAFGLYDKIRGGSMVIYGRPQSKGSSVGDLFGNAELSNFRIKGAPSLAKILSAMSIKGAENFINNDGVSFQKLASNFEWHFRDEGNLLILKDGRTSGSSLGLTFEGNFDQAKNTVNVSGTIIPVSGLNKAVGQIPIIGNILTGGDALIAATYKISGPARDPNISVNPLSVLAPGFLRKIFFEGETTQTTAPPKKEEN